MSEIIGIIVPLPKEKFADCRDKMTESTAFMSLMPNNKMKAEFWDDVEGKLYLHFEKPLSKIEQGYIRSYYKEHELISE